MDIRVSDAGKDLISVNGSLREARHYVLTGDLNRELWYDGKGELVRVRFAADDKSVIDYVRQ